MAGNSNTIEIKLKFLTEKIDAIQGSVKELEGLKRQALSTASALKGAALIGGITVAAREVIQVFGEVKKAIDLGGELSDLSARTGQSVSDRQCTRWAERAARLPTRKTPCFPRRGRRMAFLKRSSINQRWSWIR
ncbi:MAG: hypothetical protein WCS65_12600 [Verrucomicrobiae bacterium]